MQGDGYDFERSGLRREPHDGHPGRPRHGQRLLPRRAARSVALLAERSARRDERTSSSKRRRRRRASRRATTAGARHDFDGVLDHPNTWGPSGQLPGVDNLLTWYERETDTLIMRPVIPLEEKTEYAVVLTDRLRGSDGAPVRPVPVRAPPDAADSVRRVQTVLQNGRARELLRRHRGHRARSRRVRVDVHDAAHARGHAPPARRALRQGSVRALRRPVPGEGRPCFPRRERSQASRARSPRAGRRDPACAPHAKAPVRRSIRTSPTS